MGDTPRWFGRFPQQLLYLGVFCALSCNRSAEQEVTLQVGPEEIHRFGASSGFAHYYELPGEDDVLRIVLASYPLGCEQYQAPEPGEVFITVTLRVPPQKTLEPGEYPWKGLKPQASEPNADAPTSEEEAPPEPSALPFVRLAKDARALPPGGGLTLTKFEPETFGVVEGELRFRDADTGQAASTALLGHFSVRLCHLSLDETRRAPAKLE